VIWLGAPALPVPHHAPGVGMWVAACSEIHVTPLEIELIALLGCSPEVHDFAPIGPSVDSSVRTSSATGSDEARRLLGGALTGASPEVAVAIRHVELCHRRQRSTTLSHRSRSGDASAQEDDGSAVTTAGPQR
jgi:hypothetical protein